ncbi:MAG: DPP IV N-terminal domain-containing protein, partial [Thermoanaerobaculia bacterium]
MRSLLLLIPLLLPLPAAANGPPAGRELTVELALAEGAGGRHPSALAWSPEGERLAYLWKDAEGDALWLLDAAAGRAEPVLRRKIDSYLWSPRGDALLIVAEGDLFLLTLEGRSLDRLTQTDQEEKAPAFSPDGGRVAFVRDFDLHVLDLASRRERALTTDGEENQLLNGTTDWLYWEELWRRNATGFWWAPDGRRLAYYRFEEEPVPVYPLLDELPKYPAVRWQKYPKAGEANPRVRVGMLDLASGATTWLATGGAPDDYLARVHWAPDGERVAVEHLNREQTRLTLLLCAAGDGRCAPLHVEEQQAWVNVESDFRFLPDGRFLWGSEREGYRRLYLHEADGRRLRAVTPEGWWVASLDGIDEARGEVVVTGFRTAGLGAAERQVLRAAIDGDAVEALAEGAGWNT